MERPDIPDETGTVVILDAETYKAQRHAVRRQMTAMMVMLALALGSVVYTQFKVLDNQDAGANRSRQTLQLAKDVSKSLKILEEATSPEAVARQREVLRQTIANIGCDNRAALQDLIQQLVDRGILEPGDATIACTNGVPPTTTTPEGN